MVVVGQEGEKRESCVGITSVQVALLNEVKWTILPKRGGGAGGEGGGRR